MLNATAVIAFPLVLFLGTTTGHATEFEPNGLSANSPAHVMFEAPDKNMDVPIIPGDSESNTPDKPKDNPGTSSDALLKIVYMSDLSFGTHYVSTEDYSCMSELIDTEAGKKVAPYIQISDNRGTAAGWKLTVTQDNPFKSADGHILKGAYMTLDQPTLLSGDGKEITNQPIFSEPINLSIDGDEQPVITAKAGSGTGNTFGKFGTKDFNMGDGVQLHIVGGTALTTAYSTNLVWKLSTVPV